MLSSGPTKRVIGLMSGTSVDAVDACCVRVWEDPREDFQYEIEATTTTAFPQDLRRAVLEATASQTIALPEVIQLNIRLGELFAQAAEKTMAALEGKKVDAIGSHGQTLYHDPDGRWPGTLQLGEPAIIAERTGVLTVADFRPADMAAGGQGAPLVPFVDALLFRHREKTRCVQNIGGIGNVTFLSRRGDTLAFDTGPGNVWVDEACRLLFNQDFDEDGRIAAGGQVNEAALRFLMTDPYLVKKPPKSTGREYYSRKRLESVLAHFPDLAPEDWVATLTRFTARSIAHAYESHLPRVAHEVILGGGGAKNPTLVRAIEAELPEGVALLNHEDFGIPDQYKEAMAFGILAWATLNHRPGNMPDCTGARHPAILGKVCYPSTGFR